MVELICFVVFLLLKSYKTYNIYRLLLVELLRAQCFDTLRPKCFHNPKVYTTKADQEHFDNFLLLPTTLLTSLPQ